MKIVDVPTQPALDQREGNLVKRGKVANGFLLVAGLTLARGTHLNRLFSSPDPAIITVLFGVILFIVSINIIEVFISKGVLTSSVKTWRWVSFLYLVAVQLFVVAIM